MRARRYGGLQFLRAACDFNAGGPTRLLDVPETIVGLGVITFLVGAGRLTAIGIITRIAHRIYAMGRADSVLTSSHGVNWRKPAPAASRETNILHRVAFGQGLFVAAATHAPQKSANRGPPSQPAPTASPVPNDTRCTDQNSATSPLATASSSPWAEAQPTAPMPTWTA